MRAEIQHEFVGGSTETAMSDDHTSNEWNLLKEQFRALVREGSDNVENIFDAQFRTRFSELIYQAAGFEKPDRVWRDLISEAKAALLDRSLTILTVTFGDIVHLQ